MGGKKGFLPKQVSTITEANDERGQLTAEIEVVTSVDFTNQTFTTRKLKMVNGRLAKTTAPGDPQAAGAVPVPDVPETPRNKTYTCWSTTHSDAGGTRTFVGSCTPTLEAPLEDGDTVYVWLNTADGGLNTEIDFDGLGAVALNCGGDATPWWAADRVYCLVYDGTNGVFQMVRGEAT